MIYLCEGKGFVSISNVTDGDWNFGIASGTIKKYTCTCYLSSCLFLSLSCIGVCVSEILHYLLSQKRKMENACVYNLVR